jgi:HEAT repeat protein
MCGVPIASTTSPYDSGEPVVKGRIVSDWASQLRDVDRSRQAEAIQALASAQHGARNTAAGPTLVRLLDEPTEVAARAAWALGHIGDSRCVKGIMARIDRSRGQFGPSEISYWPSACDDAHLACWPGIAYSTRMSDYDCERAEFARFVSLAFWALGRSGDASAIPFMREFATTHPYAFSSANAALELLGAPIQRQSRQAGCLIIGCLLASALGVTLSL